MSINLISQANVNIRLQKRFVNLSILVAFTVIFTVFSLECCSVLQQYLMTKMQWYPHLLLYSIYSNIQNMHQIFFSKTTL